MFSKNVSHELKNSISSLTGFSHTNNLGPYLGMPLIGGSYNKKNFQFITEKIRKKLAGWKTNCLSMTGRVTLAKSSLASIPYYAMKSSKIPRKICDDIERTQRSFIWRHKENEKSARLVRWNTICLPKELGGLGLRRVRDMNKAFLMKLTWKLKTETSNLCTQVLKGKYGRCSDWRWECITLSHYSVLWNELGRI